MTFSFSRRFGAEWSWKLSAQSPACRRNAFPAETWASRSRRLRASPAKTSGGWLVSSSTTARTASGSGQSGCCAAGNSRQERGDQAVVAMALRYPWEGGRVAAVALTVVGSVAFDSVETPFGKRERMLGGPATDFSLAARFFTDVRVVGVVGDDFGSAEMDVIESRGVNTDDITRVPGGKTFFWAGRYDFDLNVAHTLDTQLNVFGEFDPQLSDAARSSETVFLANIQPDLQRSVRQQCEAARFVALDSMNLWIEVARESLIETIR